MNFLEAKRLLAKAKDGRPLPFVFALSGLAEPFELYLGAHAARLGYAAKVTTLAFNTLRQHFMVPPEAGREVVLLLPWDVVPELDWRAGFPAAGFDPATAVAAAAEMIATLVATRPASRFVYLDAPFPPLAADSHANAHMAAALREQCLAARMRVLDGAAFSLTSYLASGCPVTGSTLGAVAEACIAAVLAGDPQPAKVLVTDFDGVLWRGVIGEDGPNGVDCAPAGEGFVHHIYQNFLRSLKNEGVLLVGVTRNDAGLAEAVFTNPDMVLSRGDFVGLLASYNAKSAQIMLAAEQLNLGLDAFVFIDDNPVELEEVKSALPQVDCLRFPDTTEGLVCLLTELRNRFSRVSISAEDRERTDLYRRRMEGVAPSTLPGGDLTEFLRGLQMRLDVFDRSAGDRDRAVQLINKTNQFNINGIRQTDAEVAEILAAGGRLYTVRLTDRAGSHGEILAMLIDRAGTARALVMSCRVFQRRVEYAFIAWLCRQGAAPVRLLPQTTDRNEPARRFLDEEGFEAQADGTVCLNAARFLAAHEHHLGLFDIEMIGHASVS